MTKNNKFLMLNMNKTCGYFREMSFSIFWKYYENISKMGGKIFKLHQKSPKKNRLKLRTC